MGLSCFLRSAARVPLRSRKDLLGLISLGPKRWDRAYTREDLRLLYALASECYLAIENSELVQRLTEEIHEREVKHAEATVSIARDASAIGGPPAIVKTFWPKPQTWVHSSTLASRYRACT